MTVTSEVSFESQGRSRVMRQNHGLLPVYADAKTGKLRGVRKAAGRRWKISVIYSPGPCN